MRYNRLFVFIKYVNVLGIGPTGTVTAKADGNLYYHRKHARCGPVALHVMLWTK